jgi:hypothetical protein
MSRAIYLIQMKSVNTALEHLGMTDMTELAACAEKYGTEEDIRKIKLVAQLLAQLAQTLGPLL